MKRKIYITEKQFNLIVENIAPQPIAIKKLVEFLNKWYSPATAIYPTGLQYEESSAFTDLAAEQVVSARKVRDRVIDEFGYGTEFTEQVIKDWFNKTLRKVGNVYQLSKNKPMYD